MRAMNSAFLGLDMGYIKFLIRPCLSMDYCVGSFLNVYIIPYQEAKTVYFLIPLQISLSRLTHVLRVFLTS